ncbi:macrophage mannose receptor 1 [Aplysia californica]|uniref:Macrophage mannose receptor 1 n=1 Tax=Aplysia californica TaxID=6500 RepID=A0ABM0JN68_APLCA|nr:macrophage mannose receptor 1 [Aplysia californica]
MRNARNSGTKPQYFWLGLSDANKDVWTWSNGQKYGTWKYWTRNRQPVPVKNKLDCVYMTTSEPTMVWHASGNCNSLKAVICQANQNAVKPTTPRPRVTCPRGWSLYTRAPTCIKLYTQGKTWVDARSICQQAGGDLVKIPDSSFSGFVNGLVNRQKSSYWIGLHDRHKENKFEWLDEDVKASFTSWAPHQPDNSRGNENCVSVNANMGMRWNDANCMSNLRFICQQPTVQNTSPATSPATPADKNCGAGWEDDPNSDSCYQMNIELLSWLDARQACQAAGGDLATISNIQEQFYLSGRSFSFNADFFWIGANDRGVETGWQWADRSPMAFINWAPHQPNNAHNSDCVVMITQSGRWDDLPCQDRYGYICEKKGRVTSPTPKPTTSPARLPGSKMWGCPVGWRGFRGSCYQVLRSTGGLNWNDAKTTCGFRASNLVAITDDAENKFVLSLLPKSTNEYVWMGLNDQSMENSFVWDDRTPITYTNWSPHEPNNLGDEDCVVMFAKTGKWNDAKCQTKVKLLVCKQNKAIHAKAERDIVKGCSQGIGYGAQCYSYIFQPSKNFAQAQAYCKSKGGNLATVNDRYVQAFLAAEMRTKPGAAYWIGMSMTAKTNWTYAWNTPFDVDFTAWDKSHTGNENNTCVGMQTKRPMGLWVNIDCNKTQGYICELPRKGFTTPVPTTTTTAKLLCPSGWFTYGNLCYKAFQMTMDNMLTWNDARDYCASLWTGGTLATVRNRGFENWMRRSVVKNMQDTFWIGLSDRSTEGGYLWEDEAPFRYSHWNPGEPNDNGGKEDCVTWNTTKNTWNDETCYVAHNFICEIPRGAVVTTPKPVPTGKSTLQCGNTSWSEYNKFCYYISPSDGDNVTKTWFQARLTCMDLGGDLISIGSDDENAFITSLVSRHPLGGFWTGLNDLDQDSFKWTDGSPLSFVSWGNNEPNDAYGSERCVEIRSGSFWNDQHCQDMRGYVCKKRPGDYTTPPRTTASTKGGCPAGFHSLPSLTKCYTIGGVDPRQRKNYTDAMTVCNQLNFKSRLASIHNPVEQKFVTILLANSGSRAPSWIGFNDRRRNDQFAWVDNSQVDFTAWGYKQPDENKNDKRLIARRDCVDMEMSARTAGWWNDKRCTDRYSFVCETAKVPVYAAETVNATGCKAGYQRFRNSCYRYDKDLYTWNQAEQLCKLEGSHLVSVIDRFEEDFIELLTLGAAPDLQMWLGLKYDLASEAYTWSDTWPVTFTNWGKGEPNRLANEGCVSHTVDGQWQDVPCQMQLSFICEQSLVPAPTKRPPPPAKCPRGWVGTNDSPYCYKLERTNLKSWSAASYACNILGGHLASVHTDSEARFLTNQIARGRLDTWIGISKGQGTGFSWSDGTALNYLYWSQGEPSDTDSTMHQDCVVASRRDGSWRDTDCFDQHAYMCKKTLYGGSSSTAPTGITVQPVGQNTQYVPPVTQNPPVTQGPWNPVTQGPQNPWTQGPQNPWARPPITAGPANSGLKQSPGNSDNGLGGGPVAGIVVGSIAIVAIAAVVIFVIRRQTQNGPSRSPLGSPSSGFDNATYSSAGGDTVKLSTDT